MKGTSVTKRRLIGAGITLGALALLPLFSGDREAQQIAEEWDDPSSILGGVTAVEANTLLPIAPPHTPQEIIGNMRMVVTAYSSTPEQTWGDPFITASGERVRDGVVATNVLPFGTQIRIPDIYGDKVFVVKDRMHPRKGYQVDIWFPNTRDAVNFGVQYAEIEILEN